MGSSLIAVTTDDEIRDKKKLQHHIKREAAKIWALSSGKIDKTS